MEHEKKLYGDVETVRHFMYFGDTVSAGEDVRLL